MKRLVVAANAALKRSAATDRDIKQVLNYLNELLGMKSILEQQKAQLDRLTAALDRAQAGAKPESIVNQVESLTRNIRPKAQPSASVQFFPTNTSANNINIELDSCVQTGQNLVCTLYVTAMAPRGGSWMINRLTSVQDENGSSITPYLVTVGSFSHNPNEYGKQVPISANTRTRVLYSFDNVTDANKLQALNITVCCTKNISFHRQ